MKFLTRRSAALFTGGFIAGVLLLGGWLFAAEEKESKNQKETPSIALPEAKKDGQMSLEKALAERRSIRKYSDEAVELADLGQILWAAQGVTDKRGFRTCPSAGATFPLETYAVVGNVKGLEAGVYRYLPDKHSLVLVEKGDKREPLSKACVGQACVKTAPFTVVFSAVFERTAKKYHERAKQYVYIEAGHAAQNVYLQATALHLGAVAVGAFTDDELAKVFTFGKDEQPLYLLPVGKPVSK